MDNTNSIDDIPKWPANDRILSNIVRKHNENMVECGKSSNPRLDGSKSITLIMACSTIGKTIPMIYLLKTRDCGIRDHMVYVKEYLDAVRNCTPQSEKGRKIEKQIKLFENDLGMSSDDINAGLEKAFTSGRF
jgi:hypothetical protein